MAFVLDHDANEGNDLEPEDENAAPTWLKVAIGVVALAVIGGLVLIDTEPRDGAEAARTTTSLPPTTSLSPTTTEATAVDRPEARGLISTTTLGPGQVGGGTAGASGDESPSTPAFVLRDLYPDRAARRGTLYAVTAFGELLSADLENGDLSILAEGLAISPPPQLVAIDGGVAVAAGDTVRFHETGEQRRAPVTASSVLGAGSGAEALIPFDGLIGLIDRTPIGSRVNVVSATFISDGVILKEFGDFTLPSTAEALGGSMDTGLDIDLAGRVVRQEANGTQTLLVGSGGVSLTSNGSQLARLVCDAQTSSCAIEVTDFRSSTPTTTTFDLPIELEGTTRDQLASAAAFSPDGRYLALIGTIGGLRAVVFDLDEDEIHFSPEVLGFADPMGTLAWDANANILFYALSNEVNSWHMDDVDTGRSSAIGFKRSVVALTTD